MAAGGPPQLIEIAESLRRIELVLHDIQAEQYRQGEVVVQIEQRMAIEATVQKVQAEQLHQGDALTRLGKRVAALTVLMGITAKE